MPDKHIVASFNDDMKELETLFLDMGQSVAEQLHNAANALRKEDRKLAKQVIKRDKGINEYEAELNNVAMRILALRQPFATDLRMVVGTLKHAGHLERIGDLIRNMAQRTNTITKAEAETIPTDTLVRMGFLVEDMILKMLEAYKTRDVDLAEAVRASDEDVDNAHNTLFREALTYMMEDPRNISGCMHLMFVAKNIERMGDHVADMAKEIIFIKTGAWPQGKRSKSDRTSKIIFDPGSLPEAGK